MSNRTKKLITIVTLFSVLIITLWLTYSHGRLVIETPTLSKEVSYKVFSKDGDLVFEASSTKTISRLLPKGVYRVVAAGEGSSIQIVTVPGFLGKIINKPELRPENYREFVGDNPGFCMGYGPVLYSYECLDTSSLAVHTPATKNDPTSTLTGDGFSYLPLKGFVNIDGMNKALLVYVQNEDQLVGLYDIDQSLKPINGLRLKDIEHDEADGLIKYKDGLIVYSEDFQSVKHFPDLLSSPKSLSLSNNSRSVSQPVAISTSGNSIGALYNSGESEDEGLGEDEDSHSGKSEFLISSGSVDRYRFDKIYTSGGYCGENMLCLLESNTLDIYSTISKKPERLYSIKGVYQTISKQEGVLVFTEEGVLLMNNSLQKGHISIGTKQGYCGSADAGSYYLLCVLDINDKRSALLVNPSANKSDSIEEKKNSLLKNSAVSDVSIYRRFVHISPNLGDMVVDPVTGKYGYDSSRVQTTNKEIERLVSGIGLKEDNYVVVNPFNP